ncbi:hypothetical protein [Kitasatospora sp. NPDC085879]|jgi:hypothetical protein|uniref:hypothetical protein n=1 Tax=Kitasatospora sp. NPDC085879 TaxID=3154769 RepID=UPI003418B85E
MALVLFLIILAIVLGIVGVVAESLLYLLFIGIAVLIIAMVVSAVRFRHGGRSPQSLSRPSAHPPCECAADAPMVSGSTRNRFAHRCPRPGATPRG